MINLFENYDNKTRELHDSLKLAGYNHFTIVMNDDGFLPDEVTSPYQYFATYQVYEDDKPAFFNDVVTPDFWEIKGDGTMAKIIDMGELRGKIFYRKNFKTRVVSFVEWLDKKQRLRSVDHYNKEGFKFAETVYDLAGTPIFKKYMNREGKEVIYENFVTKDFVVDYQGKSYFFASKREFIKFYLQEIHIDLDQVIFNSLSTPFLALYDLPTKGKGILFWQEHSKNHVPGNMRLIFNNNTERQFNVIIPEKDEYEHIIDHLSEEERRYVHASGYLYHKEKDNQYSNNILTLTNSDQIPHLEYLVTKHTDYQFHVAAITEMSSRLMNLGDYPNVKLYPAIKQNMVNQLYEYCDIYLDINEGGEILNAVRKAFDHHMLILGYTETAHHFNVTSPDNQCSVQDVEQLSQMLKEIDENKDRFSERLNSQQVHANEISKVNFKSVLEEALN